MIMKNKHIQHYFENILLVIFMRFFELIPIGFAYKMCEFFGRFAYYFFPMRKLTGYYNIKRAFPAKSDKEIFEIVKKTYISSAYFFLESVIYKKLLKNLDDNVKIFGLEYLKEAHKYGKGVVLYTAHIGNWHIMGHKLVNAGFPLNNVVKRQRNARVFDKEVKAMLDSGMKVTILQKTPKNIFKALKDGDVVEFLADQDAGSDGIFIDFFGVQASTAVGPALFSIKMGSPIVFAVDIRRDKYKHEIYIEKIDFQLGEDLNENIEELTKILTKKLEQYIIKYPEQYFWLHKRWLTRPNK